MKERNMTEILPWAGEPNYLIWTDEESGYLCLLRRRPSGDAIPKDSELAGYNLIYLCGYVLIPNDHRAASYDFSDYSEESIDWDVHGGVTFDNKETILVPASFPDGDCIWAFAVSEDTKHKYILTEEAQKCTKELASGMLIGFDCGHSGDIASLNDLKRNAILPWAVSYKNIDFVKNECTKLAKHLHNFSKCDDLFEDLHKPEEEVKTIRCKIQERVRS